MTFNPKEHITKMGQREYLEVKWRLVWFREVHPLGRIETDCFTVGDMIYVKAIVTDEDNRLLASGLSTVRDATQREATWAGRVIEKAETSAIGRALAAAGFGTQFTDEDEGDNLADSPTPAKKQAPKQEKKTSPSIDDVDAALGTTPPTMTDEQAFIFNLMQIILPMCKHENHARNAIEKAIEDSAIGKGDSLDKAAGVMLLRRMKSQWGLTEDESRGILPEALGMTMKEYLTANPRDYSGIWATLTARYAEMPE